MPTNKSFLSYNLYKKKKLFQLDEEQFIKTARIRDTNDRITHSIDRNNGTGKKKKTTSLISPEKGNRVYAQ